MDDLSIAKKYISKANRAKQDGYDFDLSFTSFKNMMLAKRCRYTGVLLTTPKSPVQKSTDRTIDRIDSSKGYVKGNVAAVCFAANKFKGMLENPVFTISNKNVIKIAKMVDKAS